MSQRSLLNGGLTHRALLMAVLAFGLADGARADVPPATNALGASPADKLVADAQKAMRAGNGRMALVILKNALTADPRNPAARVMLGEVMQGMGELGAAERELRQAWKSGAASSQVLPPLLSVMLARGENAALLSQFPDPGANSKAPDAPDILLARALALQNLKRAAEAVDAMDRSLALRRDAHGLLARARIALLQRQPADASKFVDEAIPKAVTADAMLFKTGLLLNAGENRAALDLSNQLLDKFPGNLSGRFARIEAYFALKQDDKAKPEIDDIVAKFPKAYMGSYYRAFLLSRAGKPKEAWSVAQTLPREFLDDHPQVAVMVAGMAAESGNENIAASILAKLMLKDPSPLVRVRLAAIRLKQNNPAEALKVLDPLKDVRDVGIQELLSSTYFRLGRKDEALQVLHKLEAAGVGNTQVKRSIASLEIQSGKVDKGIRDLAQLNAKNPTDPALAVQLTGALLRAKRYNEALAVADRLAGDPKQRSTALQLRGGILLAQGNATQAKVAFDKAIQADPRNMAALFGRAVFFSSQQKFAEADQDFIAILALDPKNLDVLLKRADIAQRQGRDQNVRALLGQAILAAPDNATPRLALIRYLMARRDFKNALTAAGDMVRDQPKNNDGLVLLGNIQLAVGQTKDAVGTFHRLTAMAPTVAAPQVLLGNALMSSGDRAGAAHAMDVAVKLAPASADIRAAQIEILLKQNSNDAAVAAAQAFQSANPGTAADLLVAETLDRSKQRARAVAVLKKSLADKPSSAVMLRLANYALQAKDSKGATDLMSNWLAAHPDDLAVRMSFADGFMQVNDYSRAIPQYEVILKQSPNNVIAMNNLGWLIQESDPKRAVSLLTQAQKLAPNSGKIGDSLGWVKLQQKDAAGALEILNRAHTQEPQDGEITYHLILALDANGKRDTARGLLKALLASKAVFKDRAAATQLATAWQ